MNLRASPRQATKTEQGKGAIEVAGLHDDSQISHPLLAAGWCQGVTFDAPGASYNRNALSSNGRLEPQHPRAVRGKERLVLISHACDIKSDGEKYIEALICKRHNPDDNVLGRWDQNSPRYFIVDPNEAWVADASHRIKIDKAPLSCLSHYGCAMDELQQYRFVEWLTRRYDRPTVPDHVYERFHAPVYAALNELAETGAAKWRGFNTAVNEIRVRLPQETLPPYIIGIVYLTSSALTENQAEAIDEIHRVIVGAVSEQVRIEDPPAIVELDEVPFGVLRRTQPLILDYPSWEDDDNAKPIWSITTLGG